ncbi:probable prefoldin subunit 2 [Tanacetum coccineum]
MIGGVLVERTIKEVLPALQENKEGIEVVIARLNEALERKKKELADFETSIRLGSERTRVNLWMRTARRNDPLKEFLWALQMRKWSRQETIARFLGALNREEAHIKGGAFIPVEFIHSNSRREPFLMS